MNQPMGTARERVLVVEDEALVALEIETILNAVGHEVVGIADTLGGALALVDRHNPTLALVDMQLAQGECGLAVAAALSDGGVRAIFVTGNCPVQGGEAVAIGCLQKPFSDRALAAAVAAARHVIEGRRPDTVPSTFRLY